MKNFKQLIIWQKGIELAKLSYKIAQQLPAEEKFSLSNQLNRAAVSIPANIAEGSSRESDKDYARFLQIALGSAFEVQTYCELIKYLYSQIEGINNLENLVEEIIKMLHNFIKQIKN